MKTKLEMYCSVCGSTDVGRDAYAAWDTKKQQWVLRGDPFDDGYCFNEDCEASGSNVIQMREIQVEDELVVGDLDSPIPNYLDHTKRGFTPK